MYATDVLPFGASAVVFGFNRFPRAICRIGIRLFGLVCLVIFYIDNNASRAGLIKLQSELSVVREVLI